jgi:putative membrane protein
MWGYGPFGGMGYGDGWGGGGWMMLFGGVFWVILLVVGVAAVAWMVRGPWHGGHDAHARIERGSSGLDILEERYARGELGRDEFLQKKRDILGRGGAV